MSANSGGNFSMFPEKSKNAFKSLKKAKKVEPDNITDDVLSENVYMSLNDDSEDSDVSERERPRKKPTKHKSVPKTPIQPSTSNSEKVPAVPAVAAVKPTKPPPITVTKINIVELEDKLKLFPVECELNFRLTKYGTKVFINSIEAFEKIKQFFIQNSVEFYTHSLKDDRYTKIVLYGLPDMEIEDVKTELNSKNFFPEDIKKLTIKQQKYDFQCNYILYFKKAQKIKISDLRNIRALFHLIVRWDYYIHKKQGPTQCSNCQGFSHGSRNCHLLPKCIRCGLQHKSNECPLLKNLLPDTKTPTDQLRCANCGRQHVANYSKCPKRLEIMRTRAFLSGKSARINFESNRGFAPAPQLNNLNFPPLNQLGGKAWQSHNNYERSQNPTANQRDFQGRKFSNDHQNDLLSPTECFNVFNEFVTELSQCTSRLQQLQVISQITFKYLSK
jgi:hypothetical protein